VPAQCRCYLVAFGGTAFSLLVNRPVLTTADGFGPACAFRRGTASLSRSMSCPRSEDNRSSVGCICCLDLPALPLRNGRHAELLSVAVEGSSDPSEPSGRPHHRPREPDRSVGVLVGGGLLGELMTNPVTRIGEVNRLKCDQGCEKDR
jgi:hypothetical protein